MGPARAAWPMRCWGGIWWLVILPVISLEMTWWLNHPKRWYFTIQNGNLKPAFSGGFNDFNGSKLGDFTMILPWRMVLLWYLFTRKKGITGAFLRQCPGLRCVLVEREPRRRGGYGGCWWKPWILLVKTPLKTTKNVCLPGFSIKPI